MISILVPLLAGLALFMGGMRLMRIGLFNIAGERMRHWLVRFTKTPTRGMVTGTIVTMLIQSSSAVSVITMGLANAGLLTFPRTIGIILGTNIGTTFTTQLIALNLTGMAFPIFVLGCILWLIRHPVIRAVGASVAGFGCVFIGIQVMQKIALPLQHTQLFADVMTQMSSHHMGGILIGTVFTAILHSSSAVTAITMGFMNENAIPLTMGIAIILGSNVGTCITAILAAIGGNTASKRVAWVHVFLNVTGVLLFLPFIQLLAHTVTALTDQPGLQIAHAQTIFNVVCSLLALPFTKAIAKLAALSIKEN
ncbi:Na/Pi cotransporter family protein [Aneurinibacillus tyrosinisolvens]|uniref:Na/Pi cotransporter family protein n=1 Tax=Aneurinibacillus tyrosinisolvens TaxID=1443435 RepID=UPI00063FD275|nr:Na/Pi symporter [Aneurinibacillus tyrosinisolvens]